MEPVSSSVEPTLHAPASSERALLTVPASYLSDDNPPIAIQIIVSKMKVLLARDSFVFREIPLGDIDALTLSTTSDQMLFHVFEDADERLDCPGKRAEVVLMILFILTNRRKLDNGETPTLTMYFVPDASLELYLTDAEDLAEGHLIRPDKKYLRDMHYKAYFEMEASRDPVYRLSHLSPPRNISSDRRVSAEDFQFKATLGKGAHGKVLLVEKKDSGVLYAMKILRKKHVVDAKQLEHTRAERDVLTTLQHPFLVSLKFSFQTDAKIYFVMELMKGGELFQHLKRVYRFREDATKFIAACLVLALGQLHHHGFVYRDLKPENVLLTETGYAKLADFGLVKTLKLKELARTFCGTPEYLAPEVILEKGANASADWWALGVLVYEMMFGVPPFYSKDLEKMYRNAVKSPVKFRTDVVISDEAKDFIAGLLTKAPLRRLGSVADALEVANHAWFAGLDWAQLARGEMKPPFDPMLSRDNILDNFDPAFTREPPRDSIATIDAPLRKQLDSAFQDFDYCDFESLKISSNDLAPSISPLTPVSSNFESATSQPPHKASSLTEADSLGDRTGEQVPS
mgnify:CR=1 FL=1